MGKMPYSDIISIVFGVFLAFGLFSHHRIVHGAIEGYITSADKSNFKQILEQTLQTSENDYNTILYGVKGLQLLQTTIDPQVVKAICAKLQKSYNSADANMEAIFSANFVWKSLKCPGTLKPEDTIKIAKTVLNESAEKSSVAEMRYALEILKISGETIKNPAQIADLIDTKLRMVTTNNFQNIGHAFHTVPILGEKSCQKFLDDYLANVLQTGIEMDKKQQFWEGGLTVTSLITTGVLTVKPNVLTEQHIQKLSAYLLSRRTVQTARGILALIEAAIAISSHPKSTVAITVKNHGLIESAKERKLILEVCTLWGGPLAAVQTVLAQSTTRLTDDVVVLSKQPFQRNAQNPIEYITAFNLEAGAYKVDITVGEYSTSIMARILAPVQVLWLDVGLTDVDDSGVRKLTRLNGVNGKLSAPLQADANHRLIVQFALDRRIHQTFLRLFSTREIVFVAEPDNENVYKIDVKLGTELSQSGHYHLELILGDSTMPVAVRHVFGELIAKFPGVSKETATSPIKGPEPEIHHVFRAPERRPPETISMFFTGLVLSPILVLFIVWYRIGINVSNFAYIAVPFHFGLIAIMVLYVAFWYQLDMFNTCGWLVPFGTVTFLTGHRMLKHVAKQKKLQ